MFHRSWYKRCLASNNVTNTRANSSCDVTNNDKATLASRYTRRGISVEILERGENPRNNVVTNIALSLIILKKYIKIIQNIGNGLL